MLLWHCGGGCDGHRRQGPTTTAPRAKGRTTGGVVVNWGLTRRVEEQEQGQLVVHDGRMVVVLWCPPGGVSSTSRRRAHNKPRPMEELLEIS